jgi:5-methylcytosine-specific restriction endonuclease McrA
MTDALRLCSIEDCEKAHRARGWCTMHYTRYLRHGDPLASLRPGDAATEKRCADCAETKPVAEFHRNGGGTVGWRSRCKPCYRGYLLELYYAGARETQAKYRARNPERMRVYRQRWKRRNPDRVRLHRAEYEAKKRAAAEEHVDYALVHSTADWDCGICGQPIARVLRHPHPESVTVDHIIPLARGGPHSYGNLQLAHLRCNSRKRDRLD